MASQNLRGGTKRKTEESKQEASSQTTPGTNKRQKTSQATEQQSTLTSTGALQKTSSMAKPAETLSIEEAEGDIFDAPRNCLIIHACNCQGSWGAGIAKAFHDRYPKAYSEHVDHCREYGNDLLDSAQLIPPVDAKADDSAGKHFVGCLFTSRYYGRKKDKPARILSATKPAMEDLLRQVREWDEKASDGDRIGEVRICKINSGLFAVPWKKTREVLESIDVSESEVKVVKVVSPPS